MISWWAFFWFVVWQVLGIWACAQVGPAGARRRPLRTVALLVSAGPVTWGFVALEVAASLLREARK